MAISAKNVIGEAGIKSRDATESIMPITSGAFYGAQPFGNWKGNYYAFTRPEDLRDVGRHFIYTEIDGGTSSPAGVWTAPTASVPAVLTITTAGAANDGAQLQYACAQTASGTSAGTSTAFAGLIPRAGLNIAFFMRFNITATIATVAFVAGLTPVDTTMIATSAIGVTDLIGFYKAPSATMGGVMRTSSTSTTTSLGLFTPTTNTWYEAGFILNGTTSIDYFLNGIKYSSSTVTNIPTVALVPGFAMVENAGAAATILVQSIFAGCEAV